MNGDAAGASSAFVTLDVSNAVRRMRGQDYNWSSSAGDFSEQMLLRPIPSVADDTDPEAPRCSADS